MLEHLLIDAQEAQAEMEPIKRVSPKKLLSAQEATSDWLKEIGAPDEQEALAEQQKNAARLAFASVVTDQSEEQQRRALMQIRSPKAFEKLSAMLEAHDWDFIQHTRELRSLSVVKLLKETEHHDARIRLRAIELLGKVTEVGLFTDRVEVKHSETSDSELEARIKEKLERFMIANGQLEDAIPKETQGELLLDSDPPASPE